MRIERAAPTDTAAVEELLAANSLPLDGAAEAFGTGVVAREGDQVIAAAAVEPYGDAGLLRSVVVVGARRGRGIGAGVVTASEGLARDLGIDDLYLLTETAEGWFAQRGYRRIARDEVPGSVRSSIEFTTSCSETAVAMKRRLGS